MANVERHDAEWRHIISETRGEIRINYCHSIEAADVFPAPITARRFRDDQNSQTARTLTLNSVRHSTVEAAQ